MSLLGPLLSSTRPRRPMFWEGRESARITRIVTFVIFDGIAQPGITRNVTSLSLSARTWAQGALNRHFLQPRATRNYYARAKNLRGINRNKLVRMYSLCHDCVSESPLYSEGSPQKCQKVTEGGDSWSPGRVSRTSLSSLSRSSTILTFVTF